MTTAVTLREVTPDEYVQLNALAHARTAEARRVERAQIVWAVLHGARPSATATRFGLSRPTVYTWLRRFNAHGVAGLDDLPRSGRPTTYTPQETAEVIAAALTDPRHSGCRLAVGRSTGCRPISTPSKASRSNAAASMNCCAPRGCAGAPGRAGLVNGSIRRLPKKGAHRGAPHRAAARRRRDRPG